MTSANVKDLSSIMTFVSGTANNAKSNMSSSMNFGDVMTKAESKDQTSTQNDQISSQKTKTNSSEFKDKLTRKADQVEKPKTEKTQKAEDASENLNQTTEEIPDETKEVLSEVANVVIQNIADVMDVPTEDVITAIDSLDMTQMSVLDTANIGQIVLELSGETDPMVLVTDEDIFNTVNDLTTMVDATIADAAEDMDIEVPALNEIISAINNEGDLNGMEMSVEADSDIDEIKEPAPKLTANVKDTDSESTVETDDKGNVIKTVNTVDAKDSSVDEDKDDSSEHADAKSEGHTEQGISYKNPILNNIINDVSESSVVNETPQYLSEDTQAIMDQILDHIKVNIKEDVNQLELQLHPASLGNVKINLTANKAGEVTAEFKVQNEAVKAAVEAQIQSLRETFEESGSKVTAVEVSVEMQSFDQNLWQGKEENPNQNNEPEKRRQRRININDLDALFADDADEEDILAAEMLEATGGTVDYTA